MSTEDVGTSVRKIIANFFHLPESAIVDQTKAEEVPGWDSFAHGQLILELETRLRKTLPIDRLFDVDDVGQLIAVIEGR
ncbi:hypothetical protein ASD79_00920 [Caulobacter sp. Root655]|uniref:acyl carrier protein n=1 Tax=Caulobacter sp. Root655 TaxID=1736578 RepID=UPI0006F77DAD|nr:acyl carrier protein [Caulobacter sp. Root655]KRA65877.1 hypothetical protein ASD79_00920 [Caulobacter sp. Root655]